MKQSNKKILNESERLAEIQVLSELVLSDLIKDYRRALSNNLPDKAIKLYKEIERVQQSIR